MFKFELTLDLTNIYVVILLLLLLGLFTFLDGYYFIRIAVQFLYLKYFKKEIPIDKAIEVPGICGTTDVDIYLRYMNNARYLREADFARFYWYQATGLLKKFGKGTIMQGACNARYRRPISLFTTYKIVTKVIYWDEKNVYFEQRFVTRDGFVRAVLYSQNKAVNLNAAELIGKKLGKDASYRVEIPEELQLWINSLEASSKILRKSD